MRSSFINEADMLIRTRLKAVSWLAAIIALLAILTSIWSNERLKQSQSKRDLIDEMISVAYKRSVVRAEFFISTNIRSKEQWYQLSDKLLVVANQVQTSFVSDDLALASQQLVQIVKKSQKSFERLIDNRNAILTGSTSRELGLKIENLIHSQLIIESQALLTELFKLQNHIDQELTSQQARSNALMFVIVLILTSFTFFGALIMSRSIAAPLKRLKDGIEIIATGNLDYRIDVTGNDELSDLARAGNEMAEKLGGSYISIQTLEEEIELRKSTEADLERSNKELEQFAYVASHDLQEPLRMVSSYTQLLAQRYENQLDEKANLFIHYAVDGAVRMQSLINDLLMFSRIGTRGKPLEPVDAHAVLGQAISVLKINIDEAKAIITNDQLPEVRADASQLVQLFQNLIGNAVKFRGEEYPNVHITATDAGREWLFSVRDNGIGIDRQYADKIFIIFQRLHTKEEYSGSGIGLAICKKIVERHGGRIWFESEPGKGATFFFTIPK